MSSNVIPHSMCHANYMVLIRQYIQMRPSTHPHCIIFSEIRFFCQILLHFPEEKQLYIIYMIFILACLKM